MQGEAGARWYRSFLEECGEDMVFIYYTIKEFLTFFLANWA